MRRLNLRATQLFDRLAEEYDRRADYEGLGRIANLAADRQVDAPVARALHVKRLQSTTGLAQSLTLLEEARPAHARSSNFDTDLTAIEARIDDPSEAAVIARGVLETAPENPYAAAALLISLIRLQDFDQALRYLCDCPASALAIEDPQLALFRKLGASRRSQGAQVQAEQDLFDQVVERLASHAQSPGLKKAQLLRLAAEYDAAAKALETYVPTGKGDAKRAKAERARIILHSKNWNGKAGELRRLLAEFQGTALGQDIDRALGWINTLATFYDGDPDCAPDYKLPDAAFEWGYLSGPWDRQNQAHQNRVALIGATLAAGGAEHVLANAMVGFQRQTQVEVQAWFHSLRSDKNHDRFLIRNGENAHKNVSTLTPAAGTAPPFDWLPPLTAKKAQAVYDRILQERPAVLHAWQDATCLEAAYAGLRAGVPKIIVHPHNMRPDHVHKIPLASSFRRAYRAMLQRHEVELICVSEASLRSYLDWLDIERNARHHVVYNGFDWPAFPSSVAYAAQRDALRKQFDVPQDAFVVGGVFRVIALKRPLLWLDAAAKLLARVPDAYFLLYGDGPELGAARAHAATLGITDRVRFCGFVSEAAEKVQAFDALLHTSQSEGLPTVLIEAQAMGVRVVAANVGGVKETLLPNSTLVPDGAVPDQFADGLAEFAQTPLSFDNKQAMNRAICQSFGIDQMISQFIQIYRGQDLKRAHWPS